jgi:hypothetical protein
MRSGPSQIGGCGSEGHHRARRNRRRRDARDSPWHARDITFAMASPAPQATLRRYAERMGWTDIPWYTSSTERFSADFEVDESFSLNIFLRDGDDVYRTYFLQRGSMVQSIGSAVAGQFPIHRRCPSAATAARSSVDCGRRRVRVPRYRASRRSPPRTST